MKIAGFVKNSFVDYPNKISAVIFTYGCNFNCWYCHNKHIINDSKVEFINENIIFEFLKKRKGLIDGVVITGGEPTLQKNLTAFIEKIKHLNYFVKLDTNGTNPDVLQNLIQKKLVDYVAMDIKTSLENYDKICGVEVNTDNIKKSIEILKSGKVEYEFRTTISPDINEQDFDNLLIMINGSKNYYLQKCNIPLGYVNNISNSKNKVENFLKKAKKHVKNSCLRGFE